MEHTDIHVFSKGTAMAGRTESIIKGDHKLAANLHLQWTKKQRGSWEHRLPEKSTKQFFVDWELVPMAHFLLHDNNKNHHSCETRLFFKNIV